MTIKNKLCILSIGLVSVAPKLSAMKPEMPELKAMNKLQSINYSENVSKTNAVFEFLLSQEDAFISENKYPVILPFPTEDNTIINKALELYLSHVSDLAAAKRLSSYRAARFMHHVLSNLSNILTGDLSRARSDFELYISTIDSIEAEINQSQDITYQKSVLINGLESLKPKLNFLKQSNKSEYEHSITSLTSKIISLKIDAYSGLSPKEHLECIKFVFPKDSIQYILMNDDRDNLIEIMNQPSRSIHKNIDICRLGIFVDQYYVNTLTLIDLAALNGSVECFKHLSLNNVVTYKTFDMAVIGGNIEIVQLLKLKGIVVGSIDALMLAMRYCRYDIANLIYNSIDMSNTTMSTENYSYCLMHANNNTILTKLMDLPNQSTISFEIIMKSRNSSDMLGFIIENSISFPNIVINGKDFRTISIFKEHTVIDWAIRNNRIDVLEILIAKDTDVNYSDKYGIIPLCIAVDLDKLSIVQYLVANGANVNAGDKYGITPLCLAVDRDKLSIVQYLVANGADVNAGDKHGNTPLYIAASRGSLSIVQYLVANGADVNAGDKHGNTPLYIAASRGSLSIVQYLVANGADVNAGDKYGTTPLHVAVESDKLSIVQYLVANGANINARDKKGITPLDIAASRGSLSIVEYLVEKGADVNAKAKKGSTPLHVAASRGSLSIVQYLVEKGADVNAGDKQGSTPLHRAVCICAPQSVVEYLVAKGANINAGDKYGTTPLHNAVHRADLSIVKYLVENGADVNCRDEDGRTPLNRVKSIGYKKKVADYLIANGATE